ncbi:MAG TPA: acetate/propionate family kinase, partial [Rhizobiales bacterium]|nr:acetate/propionate family kinase [Hyphomicrobiales bacterium]
MTDAILALNAGSSSIKFALYAWRSDDATSLAAIARGEIEGIGDAPRLAIREANGNVAARRELPAGSDHKILLHLLLEWIDDHLAGRSLIAVGHRVVHGGTDFSAPVLIDETVLAQLERLVPLAPLHQPHNLAAIRCLAEAAPGLPQVACFDTGFHRTNLSLATTFALPRALTDEGVRRYGFHGLSYEYIAGALPHYAGAAAEGRVVVAHLGHGASMCAMRARRSVATTMGFTALDGLPMGRRCGTLDPGVLLFLMREKGMDYESLTDLLYHRSGLLGVSGISDDMRDLLASQSAAAKEAVDLFTYRIGRELGSLAGALGGLDVLVFTGGIGEHASAVRERVCQDAGWLGIRLDS